MNSKSVGLTHSEGPAKINAVFFFNKLSSYKAVHSIAGMPVKGDVLLKYPIYTNFNKSNNLCPWRHKNRQSEKEISGRL